MAHIKLTNGNRVDIFPSHFTTKEILQEKVGVTDRNDKEDPFYVVNLGGLIHLHKHVGCTVNMYLTNIVSYFSSGMICCPQ